MMKRAIGIGLVMFAALVVASSVSPGEAQAAGRGQPTDWQRFYNYPYVYYPHNFQQPQQYDSMYYRYPADRRIPVYNKGWYNEYPSEKPYYKGHHFILDVF